jgi:hypothetical protein
MRALTRFLWETSEVTRVWAALGRMRWVDSVSHRDRVNARSEDAVQSAEVSVLANAVFRSTWMQLKDRIRGRCNLRLLLQ